MNQKDSFSKLESQKFLEDVDFLMQPRDTRAPFKADEAELRSIGQYLLGTDKGISLDLDLEEGTLPFGHHSPYDFKFNDSLDQKEFTSAGNFKIGFIQATKDDFFSQLSSDYNLTQSCYLTAELVKQSDASKIGLYVSNLIWQDIPLSKLASLPYLFIAFRLTREIQVLFFKDEIFLEKIQKVSKSQKMFNLLFSNVVHNSHSHFKKIANVLEKFVETKLPEAKAFGRSLEFPSNYFNDSQIMKIRNELSINLVVRDGHLRLFFTPILSVRMIEETLEIIKNFRDS